MNNQIKSDMYNKAYKYNAASLFIYKSTRKNSKCELISINHLISKNQKIHDERIADQLIGILEKIIYISKEYNNCIILKYYADLGKNASFINANNDLYCSTDYIRVCSEKTQFSSIEQTINYLYDLFALIYPYNEISKNELYNNPSIKYFIRKYYNNKKGGEVIE